MWQGPGLRKVRFDSSYWCTIFLGPCTGLSHDSRLTVGLSSSSVWRASILASRTELLRSYVLPLSMLRGSAET